VVEIDLKGDKSMNHLEQSKIREMVTLHQEIVGHLRQSLEKAIRLGELLTEQKASLKHGEFTGWIKDNLPFTDRTARNYMRLYRERYRLKTETVSDLKSAYLLVFDSEALKAAKYVSALKRLQKEIDDLRALEQEMVISDDPLLSIEERLEPIAHIIKQAEALQWKATELHLRVQREMGKALNELESLAPDVDWIGIIQDEQSYQQFMGAIDERIQELSA